MKYPTMKSITKCSHCNKIVVLNPDLDYPIEAAIEEEAHYRKENNIPEQMIFDGPSVCPECGTRLERCPQCGEFAEMISGSGYAGEDFIACSACQEIVYHEDPRPYII